jgi:hypothetical protein
MPDELTLPVIAAAVLLWYLICALRQWRGERPAEPMLVWREATVGGWSEWHQLTAVAPSADYTGVLAAVRAKASPDATAVQFANVVRPADAPDFTLRVLFMSAVWEPSDRALAGAK